MGLAAWIALWVALWVALLCVVLAAAVLPGSDTQVPMFMCA